MKISFYPPRNRFRVSYEVNGKQHRRFFATKTAAETFMADRRQDVKQFGVPYATLTPLQRAEIQVDVDRLKRAGWTLRAAVDITLKHGKAPPALPLQTLAVQCLRAKEAKGCRPRSLRKFRTTLDRFLIGRRDRPASEVTSADVQEFLTCNGWRPATARSFLIDLRTLFAWGVRNKLCRENPALAVDLPRLEDAPPGILTPTQAAALVFRCQEAEPTLLATLTLCLFAGVRPEEARRLAWEDIGPDFVNVRAHKAKTRRRRLVTIMPQLRAWLDLSRGVESELPVANYANKFNRVRRLAGLFKD
jgi:integrase